MRLGGRGRGRRDLDGGALVGSGSGGLGVGSGVGGRSFCSGFGGRSSVGAGRGLCGRGGGSAYSTLVAEPANNPNPLSALSSGAAGGAAGGAVSATTGGAAGCVVNATAGSTAGSTALSSSLCPIEERSSSTIHSFRAGVSPTSTSIALAVALAVTLAVALAVTLAVALAVALAGRPSPSSPVVAASAEGVTETSAELEWVEVGFGLGGRGGISIPFSVLPFCCRWCLQRMQRAMKRMRMINMPPSDVERNTMTALQSFCSSSHSVPLQVRTR